MQYYLTGNNKEMWIDKAAKAQILKDRYYSRNDWFLITVDGGDVYKPKVLWWFRYCIINAITIHFTMLEGIH